MTVLFWENFYHSRVQIKYFFSSSESSDTDTSSTDWGTVFQKSIDGCDHFDSQTKVIRLKVKSSDSVSQSGQAQIARLCRATAGPLAA